MQNLSLEEKIINDISIRFSHGPAGSRKFDVLLDNGLELEFRSKFKLVRSRGKIKSKTRAQS